MDNQNGTVLEPRVLEWPSDNQSLETASLVNAWAPGTSQAQFVLALLNCGEYRYLLAGSQGVPSCRAGRLSQPTSRLQSPVSSRQPVCRALHIAAAAFSVLCLPQPGQSVPILVLGEKRFGETLWW